MNNEINKMIKKIENGQFQKIKPNQIFIDFYEKLVQQFEEKNIPRDALYLIKDQARIFAIDNQLRMSENVIVLFSPEKVNIKFLPHENGIELYRFEMIETDEEIWTELMSMFIEVSKQLNIKIYLNPSFLGRGKSSKGDEKRMKRFYRSCGFNPIPGLFFWRN